MTPPDAVLRQTIEDIDPASEYIGSGVFGLTWGHVSNIPSWGSPHRAAYLRKLWHDANNTLVIGALTNLIAREQQTPWEISGGPRLTPRFQAILQNAQYGEGWDAFKERLWQDYLGQDIGAFIQIIGPGNPDTPLTRAITGITTLDACRCYVTGNPEYPVWYQPHRSGGFVKLHASRVVRLVDMPSPDPRYKGQGLCALSRAIAIAERQIMVSKFYTDNLSDKPTQGFLHIPGMSSAQWEDMERKAAVMRDSNANQWLNNLMPILQANQESSAKVTLIPFAQLPEDYRVEAEVHLLALAIQDDPTEIWPLTGQGLSTGSQSQVLNAKGKVRMLGKMRTVMERTTNRRFLPRALEFQYKPDDTEQTKTDAEVAQLWGNFAQAQVAAGVLTPQAAQRLLANTVGAVEDVLLDDAGQIRLPDDDPKEDQEVTGTDETPLDTQSQASYKAIDFSPPQGVRQAARRFLELYEDGCAGDGLEQATVRWARRIAAGENVSPEKARQGNRWWGRNSRFLEDYDDQCSPMYTAAMGWFGRPGRAWFRSLVRQMDADESKSYKTLQSARIDFELAMEDFLSAAENGDMDRRRAGIVLRALINRHGNDTYREGLEAGGVRAVDISDDDLATIRRMVARQSQYVTSMLNDLFADNITPGQLQQKSTLWFNKSIYPFYTEGLRSADRNGYYSWRLGNTEDHCRDCINFSRNHIHRMRDWIRAEWVPKSGKLECGGWQCDCSFAKDNGPARGRFPRR
jgi:hypothetical protein